MTRQEFINILLPLIIQDGADRATADKIIAMKPTSELAILHTRFVREGRVQPPTPTVTQADADQAARHAEQELETIRDQHAEALSRARGERNADAIIFKLRQDEADLPQRQRDLVRARQIIVESQAILRSYSLNEANVSLLLSVIDPANMTLHAISQAIASNAVNLSTATAEEHEQFRLADIEAQNQRLLKMNPMELKSVIRQESEHRARQSHEQETNRVLAAQQQADSYAGYPEMPLVNSDGVKLDSRFFRRASSETIRVYIRRFGNAQITNAIRTRN